jgi:hypothetical protein
VVAGVAMVGLVSGPVNAIVRRQIHVMIPLDSNEWSHLSHAYGEASDIPALLQELEALPSDSEPETEPYFSLWSAICHQGDVYTASYAAVPHIVRIIGSARRHVPWTLFQMIACIEIARATGRGPEVPANLRPSYDAALHEIPLLVAKAADAEWDHWYCGAALAALAASKGLHAFAEAQLELDPDTIKNLLHHKYG